MMACTVRGSIPMRAAMVLVWGKGSTAELCRCIMMLASTLSWELFNPKYVLVDQQQVWKRLVARVGDDAEPGLHST